MIECECGTHFEMRESTKEQDIFNECSFIFKSYSLRLWYVACEISAASLERLEKKMQPNKKSIHENCVPSVDRFNRVSLNFC